MGSNREHVFHRKGMEKPVGMNLLVDEILLCEFGVVLSFTYGLP